MATAYITRKFDPDFIFQPTMYIISQAFANKVKESLSLDQTSVKTNTWAILKVKRYEKILVMN